jgi:hypothetical protein
MTSAALPSSTWLSYVSNLLLLLLFGAHFSFQRCAVADRPLCSRQLHLKLLVMLLYWLLHLPGTKCGICVTLA